jgi:hypothetical protein
MERILSSPTMFPKYMESQIGSANLRKETALRKEYYDNPTLATKYPTVEAYLLASGMGDQSGGGDGLKFLGSRPAQ